LGVKKSGLWVRYNLEQIDGIQRENGVSEHPMHKPYTRKVTAIERFFARSPFAIVTMVARIRGEVTERSLRTAVDQVKARHPNLSVRIVQDEDGDPLLTTEGAQEIPVVVVPRQSDDHWASVVAESSRIPFEFETHPAVRIFLIQSPAESELVILCHHIICDGLSLAYVTRDILQQLGNPAREVEVLPDPIPIGLDNIAPDVSTSSIVRFFINRMNKQWDSEKILFDQADYRTLTSAYWGRYTHQVLPIELSEDETTSLIERCRNEEVTVNSALAAAFVAAQAIVLDEKSLHPGIGIGASLRDRLRVPAGEVMGFYAGIATLKHKYNHKAGFWENARNIHRKATSQYANKTLFNDLLNWLHLDPTIMESIHFKRIGVLVQAEADQSTKLFDFSQRADVISSILKRDNMDSLDKIYWGTAVTNLTRLDFPTAYGDLELDRLIFKPGGGFPLVTVNLVVGAVTCAGKLSIVVEYVEDNIQFETMEQIKEKALECLFTDSS